VSSRVLNMEAAGDHVLFSSSPSQSGPGTDTVSDCGADGALKDIQGNGELLQNQVASAGSALHWEDQCKPCLFVHTKVGCQNGARCEFCHFPHKRKNKPRPCKGKRDRYRKLINRMEEQIAQKEGEEDHEDDGITNGKEMAQLKVSL